MSHKTVMVLWKVYHKNVCVLFFVFVHVYLFFHVTFVDWRFPRRWLCSRRSKLPGGFSGAGLIFSGLFCCRFLPFLSKGIRMYRGGAFDKKKTDPN